MSESHRTFLPAAGHDWALPLYDPFVKLFGGDKTRKMLIDEARLQSGQRVLEIGCGTGSLVVPIKQRYPGVDVVALDPDPKALARANQKALRANVAIQFDEGFSDSLPYSAASFDRVFSSLMFHHLPLKERASTLAEVRRVLKPGGMLVLLDFAGPQKHGFLARFIHASRHLQDNDEDKVLSMLRDAGFADVKKTSEGSMFFGQMRVNYYQATAPA